MRRAAGEGGFTLVELLVTMVIGMIALGGVVQVLGMFLRGTSASQRQAEAQDMARTTIDRLTVSLRNAIATDAATPAAVERAGATDLVFQAVDPFAAGSSNALRAMRQRYCLDIADPANGRLVHQVQRWTSASGPALPAATQCPGTGWDTTRVIASNIVNPVSQPGGCIWSYSSDPSAAPVGRCAPPPALTAIRQIQTRLVVNVQPADVRLQRDITGGVAVRNANQRPTARFALNQINGYLVANAATSDDPDGDVLTYEWMAGTTSPGTLVAGASQPLYQRSGLVAGTTYHVTLIVRDPGGLSHQITKSLTAQ